MTAALPDPRTLADRLRQPEYTGENRCLPCTAVNLVIAAAASAAVGYVSLPWGVAAFALFVGVIYLRGYLVPGTPSLTKRYLPDRVLRLFDKHGTATGAATGEAEAGDIDVEALLWEVGAVTDCEHEDDLCLSPAFGEAWRERVEALREDDTTRDDLARLLGDDPAGIRFDEYGQAFVAWLDGRRVGQWESRAAFLADVAAANALRERYDGWADLDVEARSQLLSGLRIFVERCPACDGPVALEQETVKSCCRSVDVVAVTCGDCEARLFEVEQPAM